MELEQIVGQSWQNRPWTNEEQARALKLAETARGLYSNFNISDYMSLPFGAFERIVALGSEIAEKDGASVAMIFEASPELLKYGLDTFERVADLSSEIAKTNTLSARGVFESSPNILAKYKANDVLQHLDKVFGLCSEIAETSGHAAHNMFWVSPELLKYGLDTFERVANLSSEIAKKYDVAAATMLTASPELLEYGLDTFERVANLGSKMAETNSIVAYELFSHCPGVLRECAKHNLLQQLDKVFGLCLEIAKKDGVAAFMMFEVSSNIAALLGKYSDNVSEYLQRSMPLSAIKTLCSSNFDKLKNLGDYLAQTNFGRLGKKKVKSLLDIIGTADLCAQISSQVDFESLDTQDPTKAAQSLDNLLLGTVRKMYGIKSDIETIKKFRAYLPYLKEKREQGFAGLLREVFEGRGSHSGIEIRVAADKEIVLEDVRTELARLAGVYTQVTGNETEIVGKTLGDLAQVAHIMYAGVKEWKATHAEQLKNVKELEPNLKRLADLRNRRDNTYIIRFAPNDYAGQLGALAKVPSCLSPSENNFSYTKHYLTDTLKPDSQTGIFFSVIRDLEGRVVGRTTIAQGRDASDGLRVARVSRIYPESLGISAKTYDSALAQYAKQIGAGVLTGSGELRVPGVGGEAYDDHISSGGKTDIIKIAA